MNKIHNFVKKNSKVTSFEYHVLDVVENAKFLLKSYPKADEEVVILGAYLHDIGRDLNQQKGHQEHGVEEVNKLLKSLNYDEITIKKVCDTVKNHNSSKKLNINEEIVRNADAKTNIKNCLVTTAHGFQINNFSFKDTIEWINKKIKRNWNEKLTLPEARVKVKKHYEAFEFLIKDLLN